MEKLFGIPAVMVMIYKNLAFADQLRLARVNSFLRSIFEDFIFPAKYTKLKITTLIGTEKLLVSDDENENCMLLTDDEVKNFLHFGADKVDQMHVMSGLHYKDPYIIDLFKFFSVEACGNFQSLTCLHYDGVSLSEKHLLQIAENFPKLSEFRLINCTNEANGKDLMVGRGVSISTLARMHELKSLRVHNRFEIHPIRMSLFCQLITNLRLECLKLTALLIKLDMQDNLLWKSFHHHLKELELYFDAETLEFFKRAGILKNLVKLNLQMRHDVTDSVFATITKACENLECLTIGSNTNYKKITNFQIPPNLKELTLNSQPLKRTHVIDLLTKFKIEKLSCTIDGDPRLFKDLKMSPYIKVLDLKGINTIQFPSFYSNNNTLKELTWREYGQNVPGTTHNYEGLKSCKNLETLIVYSGYVPIDVVLELKHLQKLHFNSGNEQLSWSYIIGVLTHSSLKEFYSEYYPKLREDATNIPAKGFPSTVTLVHIDLDFLDNNLDFWLDMLQQNPTMLIKCERIYKAKYILSFLKKLIQHDNFPMDLREVKVWGFNLNCKDLRKNFLTTIDPLKKVKNSTCNDTLVLRRKQI